MGRKRAHKPKKRGGGVLRGMRGGVQSMAKKVSAERGSRRASLIWNIITIVAVLVAAAFLLRRFGVIQF